MLGACSSNSEIPNLPHQHLAQLQLQVERGQRGFKKRGRRQNTICPSFVFREGKGGKIGMKKEAAPNMAHSHL